MSTPSTKNSIKYLKQFFHKLRKIGAELFYFLASLMLIFLTGCPADGVCINPTNKQASSLILNLAKGPDCREAAFVVEVNFYLNDQTKAFFPIIWNIKSKSKSGQRLNTLVYGKLPEGFTQTAPALPISPGDKISVDASNGYTENNIEITLEK